MTKKTLTEGNTRGAIKDSIKNPIGTKPVRPKSPPIAPKKKTLEKTLEEKKIKIRFVPVLIKDNEYIVELPDFIDPTDATRGTRQKITVEVWREK